MLFSPRWALCSLILLLALSHSSAVRAAEERHFLYASSPDGAQTEGRSGTGILVFDIDHNHSFVRRIEIPSFREGIRGFTGCARTHRVYFSTTSRRLGCYDVEADKVLWEHVYEAGCDRACITPDGKKIYVPTGWWYKGPDSGFLVIDASNGKLLKRIPVGLAAHNSIASLDGKQVYLGTETMLTAIDPTDDHIVVQVKDVGESGVFPFTIDSQQKFAYVCLGKTVGFDVVSLKEGKVVNRVLAGEAPIRHRTHGAGLTPDEKELWISDQDGKKLFIFDLTRQPAVPKGSVELSMAGHGWISFSLDGRYAWTHTPDVFDAQTKKKVATLQDEGGKVFASSKFIEIAFKNGKVSRMGNEFGLGRAHSR